jgi:hypothetical protein
MTLNSLRRILLALLFTSLSMATTANVTQAQLPFDNLTPTGDGEQEGEGSPFEQEGPMRPIDRSPVTPATSERPDDDEIGEEEPEQSVEVNERYAGWEGVGDIDGVRLSDSLRANWVMLDRNGQFSGTVRGIDGAEVAGMTIFLMNNGRLVKTAAVQADGSFIFTNVQRGAYSFVGWGEKAFFAFGANVINDNPDADESTPTTINCYAFQNETTINTDWIRYYAPNIAYRVYGRYSVEEGEDDPDQLYGFDGLTKNTVVAEPATSIAGTPVSLDSRGRLVGRVHQMNSINGRPVDLRSTKIMLLKGDNVIGSTTTDNFGIFQFTGVRPGGYGLVAVGVDGVGSIGIQAAGGSSPVMDAEGNAGGGEAAPFDFTMVSAETVGWMNHYANEVAYRQAILKPRRPMQTAQTPVDPVCPDGGIPGPDGRCPGANAENPICRSPCTTYGQWVAAGCACAPKTPALRRIGDNLKDSIQRIDDRLEESFYGTGNSSGSFNRAGGNQASGGFSQQQGGFNQAPGGFNQVPSGFNQAPSGFNQAPIGTGGGFQGGGSGSSSRNALPPIIRPEAAPPMPIARRQRKIR